MNTQCIEDQFEFHALGGHEVAGSLSAGWIASDGETLLLREMGSADV